MRKITKRGFHRDIAFFYFGLIIAFSFSGIVLNHRKDWNPIDYTYDSKSFQMNIPVDEQDLSKNYIIEATSELGKYDGHRIREGILRVFFKENAILDLDISTGNGMIEYKRKTPILGHAIFLHRATNSFWIWYSDIFGIAMLSIAISGILISKGQKGFVQRGWKLAILGMIIPILFLILFL